MISNGHVQVLLDSELFFCNRNSMCVRVCCVYVFLISSLKKLFTPSKSRGQAGDKLLTLRHEYCSIIHRCVWPDKSLCFSTFLLLTEGIHVNVESAIISTDFQQLSAAPVSSFFTLSFSLMI